jgi:hypothetical protein
MSLSLPSRIAYIATSVCFLSLCGCIVPYAYPHLTVVPAVQMAPSQPDIRAFRVDVANQVIDAGENDDILLSPVAVSSTGATHSQCSLTWDHGYYVIGIALNYPVHHGHIRLLRLYCPGHQLVEVRSGEIPHSVQFTIAPTLADQEKVIDDLLSAPSTTMAPFVAGKVRPGSASAEHRDSLLFAASEYEGLAALATAGDPRACESKDRLLKKAQDLRSRAAE